MRVQFQMTNVLLSSFFLLSGPSCTGKKDTNYTSENPSSNDTERIPLIPPNRGKNIKLDSGEHENTSIKLEKANNVPALILASDKDKDTERVLQALQEKLDKLDKNIKQEILDIIDKSEIKKFFFQKRPGTNAAINKSEWDKITLFFIDLYYIGDEAINEVNNLIDNNITKKKRKKWKGIFNFFKIEKIEKIENVQKMSLAVMKRVIKDMHTYLSNSSKHNNKHDLPDKTPGDNKVIDLNKEIMEHYLVPFQTYFDDGNLNDFIQAANSGRGKVIAASTAFIKSLTEGCETAPNRKNTDSGSR